jgi:hypothetical protein
MSTETQATGYYVGVTPTPWWRPLLRADRWALLWCVIVAAVLFIVPALFGHPAIDADNLIQNFPLRVLAGRQLASGHLPLLDPLTNSGTPLLGGMNAGALFPLTVIFAFISPIVAWIINMMAVYIAAAVGVFALLRWHRISTVPALAAGLSYAYSGAMIGQMVHLGVVQGYSILPWATLIMLALSRRLRSAPAETTWWGFARLGVPWVCATAVLWGLTFLMGEPRSIADVELLTIVVVPGVLLLRSSYWLRTWRTRVAYLATLLAGFLWGLGLGLVQLLPGWSFINFSQRSEESYSYFGAGSLAVRWTTLLFTPDLLGGNGAFGQPGFFANYNLAEVTGYAGVLALMAAVAFLTRFTWKGWRGYEGDFTIYFVLGVVGLFAAWGNFTPLGHIFRAIPLFGSTRLQSRNIILVDLPLAVILGWWLEQVRERAHRSFPRRESSRERQVSVSSVPRGGLFSGLEDGFRWATAMPAILIAAFSVALLGWGTWVVNRVSISDGLAHLEGGLRFLNVVHLLVALAAAGAVLFLRTSRHLLRVLLVILAVDIAVFVMFTSTGLIGGPGPREASRSVAVKLLGTTGRFALVDLAGSHTGDYRYIGEPNMNVFTGLASMQGYGALISTIYDDATGTHPQAMVNACHLAAGTFTQLRLSSIAISASQLMTSTQLSPTVPPTCVKQRSEKSTRRYFGRLMRVDEVQLSAVPGGAISTSPIRVQFINAKGQPVGQIYAAAGLGAGPATLQEFDITRTSPLAAGFTVSSATGVRIGNAVVRPVGSATSYQLDSNFQLAIDSSAWRLTSTQEQFSVFKAKSIRPEAWLSATAKGHVTNIRDASWGDTWVSLSLSSPSELYRSEAYLPGWRATALNTTTGVTKALLVDRSGLIEKVDVPAGTWTIHFHYHAPYIEVSSAVSAVSWVLLLGVGAAFAVKRRPRRTAKVLA